MMNTTNYWKFLTKFKMKIQKLMYFSSTQSKMMFHFLFKKIFLSPAFMSRCIRRGDVLLRDVLKLTRGSSCS